MSAERTRDTTAGRPVRIIKWSLVVTSICAAMIVISVVAIRIGSAPGMPAAKSDLSAEGRALVGSEQFDGPAGSAPDPEYVDYDTGGGGWGNEEAQTYTKDRANSRLDGDGRLIIEAHKLGDGRYTSARLVTRGKVDFDFGLLEARIKFPEGEGLHPAFWLLGSDIKTVGFPLCGEIDVMELVDSGKLYHNAIHGPLDADTSSQWQLSHDGAAPSNLTDDFHTYQVYRDAGIIKIGIDGVQVGQYTYAETPPDGRWVFDDPMYITLNIAVGGKWPGPVMPTTKFPATMLVDWIRFWR